MKELGHVAAGKREVCRLRYQSGGEEREMTVGEEPLLIGRAESCDLTLPDESVSRHHDRVSRFRKGWTITDLDSKNGVKINTFRTINTRRSKILGSTWAPCASTYPSLPSRPTRLPGWSSRTATIRECRPNSSTWAGSTRCCPSATPLPTLH